MIKLISTDFDGTLFAEFANPPIPKALELLLAELQARGAKWVINTGREMASLMEALGRARISVEPDYLVLVEREIHLHSGSQYVGLEHWNRRCAEIHSELFQRVRPALPRLVDWINQRYHARIYEDPFSPFCLIAKSLADADAIHEYLEDFCRAIPELTVVRNDVYARFSHAAYNKGAALGELTRSLDLSPREVFAVGDHLNDLPMLRKEHAEHLAAPSNAVEPVKACIRRQGGFLSQYSHGNGVLDALTHFLGSRA